MADGEGDHGRRSRSGGSRSNSRGPIAIAAVAGLLALTAIGMASCGDRGNGVRFWQGGDNAAANSCPRPASMTGSEFNAQETGLRALRRAAFQNDFFAQLELGARYSAVRATDKNIEDPIESATWIAMALANDEGYAPINRVNRGGWGGWRPLSRYDDCRAFERHEAYRKLDRLLGSMTLDEQGAVRDRVIYILSTQDAEGYRTLARLHDSLYGPYGEPEDNREAREAWGRGAQDRGQGRDRNRRGYPAATSLFQRNDVDAYLYNYLAVQTGDVGAYVLMRDFERSAPSRAQYQRFVEVKARQWTPPFEFYPNTAPQSGVPFSDESRPRGDAYEYALGRMAGELPFIHVGRALRYLGVTDTAAQRPEDLSKRQIETLEAMLGHPMEGRLSYLERVRAIQMAAVNGSSEAQLVLAVMYAEGIGLPADYARAFKWFEEAARQGSPEAKFAMSSYFALGVSGVADQDKAQAVAYRIDSALSGFGPSAGRLQAVLAQVSRSQRR